MKIVMGEEQYEELKDLVGIFDCMYFNDDKVECFDLIKEITDHGGDTDEIEKEKKKRMNIQVIESFEFIEALNGYSNYKDQFLSYFSD